ncbi:hypothetical protein SPRG_04201 [Saprolegnia parasitica CBS 223.65]|uniref:Uncharacterized protein n=1 Tax=Saprolegnia parasitica (strain CBS 223.65) TaxID=695850 RepID=A0A067CJU5_SAPPC|nr:hypothetical protein SPRG_04201 [Saprolegnia parasitica CBS 223.65]KDO31014.1 hypothetical protein SPRG_04201 [Saprolegnia parasitica CBS 223.65]|eukprot:XP_012198195.1 hypothetical protein SPRG_04201 [Saprolegnia parasitica CBS 223.65]
MSKATFKQFRRPFHLGEPLGGAPTAGDVHFGSSSGTESDGDAYGDEGGDVSDTCEGDARAPNAATEPCLATPSPRATIEAKVACIDAMPKARQDDVVLGSFEEEFNGDRGP